MLNPLARAAGALVALLLGAVTASAQFQIDNTRIPNGSDNDSSTENVDFGDLDLDGDWDVVMADGGDDGNDQNRVWINQGGDQTGTLGEFEDETARRFPVVNDDSRDVELVDFDADGDLDLYTSNTAELSNQGNRWWTNLGGNQAGSLGFYADETSSRWLNLAGTGSSIASSQLINGSFIDWSCDCDFGDLDNDGDMDLVHSSYGGNFLGNVPTRIFLNDGDGHFTEFNPGGFQLSGATIADGNPGLWCEGFQAEETVNTTGSQCDIATTALDIDLGDIDGDFDLDILHGARNEAPRMFVNRLDGSSLVGAKGGGQLAFRDLTGAVFPLFYTSGNFGHYEQEMGDLDGDGDLDIYGLNWNFTGGFQFNDYTFSNDGDGNFSGPFALAGSSSDDNEGDFLDYDNDGDLDLYVANFSGQDKLYRNNNDGGTTFSFTLVTLPTFTSVSLDGEACDVDGDGDYDMLVAEDDFAANTFLENTTEVADTTAPYIPNVEDVGNQTAQTAKVPVRAHVYDNAPYYITWFNETSLQLEVNGVDLTSFIDAKAKSSGGQVFRAELPGNLVGDVDYSFVSEDGYGNQGTSATTSYTATSGLTYAVEYGTSRPGTLGELVFEALSVPFAGTDFYLRGGNAPPNTYFLILQTTAPEIPPMQIDIYALFNVGGMTLSFQSGFTDADGNAVVSLPVKSTILPGTKAYAQFFTLNGTVDVFASSKALDLTSQ